MTDVIEPAGTAPADNPVATTPQAPAPQVTPSKPDDKLVETVVFAPDPVSKAAPETPPTGEMAGQDEPSVEATWPDDWRERFAKKDEALLKRLKRFTSPENVLKSYLELEKKMAAGQKAATLPDNPTVEEVAAYRKANGIPEAIDGYAFHAPAGIELTDADKAEIDYFRGKFLEANLPAGHAEKLMGAYFERRLQAEAELRDAAREATATARAELKAEFGKDYKRNTEVAKTWLDGVVGSEGRDALSNLVLDNGMRLGDHPAFVRLAVQAGLATAGDDTLAVAEYGGSGKSLTQQLDEAVAVRRTDPKLYNSPEFQEKLLRLSAAVNAQSGRR